MIPCIVLLVIVQNPFKVFHQCAVEQEFIPSPVALYQVDCCCPVQMILPSLALVPALVFWSEYMYNIFGKKLLELFLEHVMLVVQVRIFQLIELVEINLCHPCADHGFLG